MEKAWKQVTQNERFIYVLADVGNKSVCLTEHFNLHFIVMFFATCSDYKPNCSKHYALELLKDSKGYQILSKPVCEVIKHSEFYKTGINRRIEFFKRVIISTISKINPDRPLSSPKALRWVSKKMMTDLDVCGIICISFNRVLFFLFCVGCVGEFLYKWYFVKSNTRRSVA
jgi:hypothetical protein